MAFLQNTVSDLDGLLIQIDNISGNGTTATVNTIAPHGLSTGDNIVITGLNGAGASFNGTQTNITVTDGDTFTFSHGTTATEGTINGTSEGQIIRDNGDGSYDTPEIHINAAQKRFSFKGGASGNSLYQEGTGVVGQALYSLFKFLYKNVQSITKFDFPMLSITNEQFEFIDGWEPDDGVSRQWTDLTFVTGSPDTITTAGTGDDNFTLWFKAGDRISITGSASNNFKDLRVASVSSTTLTFATEVTEIVAEGTANVTATLTSNIVHQAGETFETTTRKMIRTAGWSEVDGATVKRTYAGIVTLGTLVDNTDQPYFVQNDSFTAPTENTIYTGPVNEAVPIYLSAISDEANYFDFTGATTITTDEIDFTDWFKVGDSVVIAGSTSNNGTEIVTAVAAGTLTFGGALFTVENGLAATSLSTTRDSTFKIFVRERGKTYEDADLTDIGVSQMTYIVYRFPVSNSVDLNINTTNDNALAGAAISSLSGDGSTTTVVTSVNHGLYTGAPVRITGTVEFTPQSIASVTVSNATTFTFDNAFNGTETIGGGETAKLDFVDIIDLEYLVNPDTGTDNVRIRGEYRGASNSDTITYNLGDVVWDGGAADPNKKWYYLNATNGTDSIGATVIEDVGKTWTSWNSAGGYGERNIEEDSATTGTYSAYTAILDLNNGGTTPGATKEVAYEWCQWKLRSNTTIDIGASRNGEIADTLIYFVGSQLHTNANATNTIGGVVYPFAVVADDIANADVNLITYHEATTQDQLGTDVHLAPTVVQVSISFNNNLSGDADSIFYAYYTTGTGVQAGNDYGTVNAIEVKESNGNNVGETIAADMTVANEVPTGGVYNFNYAYTSDDTNGRAGNSITNITVVAIGLGTGQYVSTSGNITETGGQFSLVAPLERNYSNPA